jgi:hypothetical protein
MFQPIITCVPDDLEIEGGNKPTVTVPPTQDGERFAFVEVRLWAKDWGSGDYVDEIEFLITVYDARMDMLDNDLN